MQHPTCHLFRPMHCSSHAWAPMGRHAALHLLSAESVWCSGSSFDIAFRIRVAMTGTTFSMHYSACASPMMSGKVFSATSVVVSGNHDAHRL